MALAVTLVGRVENALFIGVAFCNTVLGIFQELRAKMTLDKLAILSQAKVTVVRDGTEKTIAPDEIVLDEIVVLAAGNQICADAVVLKSVGLEMDESLLTGESARIQKTEGATVLSGSYVVGGLAYAKVISVGENNFASRLTSEAMLSKKKNAKLLLQLNMIIRVLSFVIIPLGALLFISSFSGLDSLQQSVLSAVAAMVSMIPDGLILLSGISLTVGAINLARRSALVQALPSIETLARVDVLCLDKTGTITDGTMGFDRTEPFDGFSQEMVQAAVSELMGNLPDKNATATALRDAFGTGGSWKATTIVPFTSDRKWSGASFEGIGSYLLGAPESLFGNNQPQCLSEAHRYASQGFRVLCLAFSENDISDPKPIPAALILLSDNVRTEARETFRFFENEGVTLKVISGDSPHTVSAIAAKAEIKNSNEAVDMSKYGDDDDFSEIAEKYTVFGRVTPHQKRGLIRAMQNNGHTACMTGDGVNDILAMREAHCSVAMIGGSDAARSACDFVLVTSDFKAMIGVLREGRRVINNIERVACLYLSKTVFSVLFALLYTVLAFDFPYAPLQITPVNALTLGIPTFFLALRANYVKPAGLFAHSVLTGAIPTGLAIVFSTLAVQVLGARFGLSWDETSTMSMFLIGTSLFTLVVRLTRPLTKPFVLLYLALVAAFAVLFTVAGHFFQMVTLLSSNAAICLSLAVAGFFVMLLLSAAGRRVGVILDKRSDSGVRLGG